MLTQTDLNLLIISDDCYYENVFRQLKTVNTVNITTTHKPVQQQLNAADIVICDQYGYDYSINKYVIKVLLISDEEYHDDKLDIHSFHHVWVIPMTQMMVEFNYRRLIEQVLVNKKNELNESFLNTLINSIPDLVWFKDLAGAHLKVNEAFGKAVGKPVEQCIGRGHYYIWDLKPDEYANGEYVCLETEEEVIQKRKTCLFDEKVKSQNGLRQFKTYKSPLYDYAGNMFGTVGIAKDVTDMDNISRELEIVLTSVPFATLLVDHENKIVYANTSFYNTFHINKDDQDKLNYEDICTEIFKCPISQLNNDKILTIMDEQKKPSYLRIQQQSLEDIFGNHFGYFVICIDITKEHELQKEILQHANTDFLTGLYNRRYFYEAVQNIHTNIAFIYFDLDAFKQINDSYGHQVGDKALILMAQFLNKRFQDDLIIRLGGDEFLVAKTFDNDIDEIVQMVEVFIIDLKNEFQKTKEYECLSTSAGVAYSSAHFDIDQLLLRADTALYKAKMAGKMKVCLLE